MAGNMEAPEQAGIRIKARKDYGDGSYYSGEMIDGLEDGRGDLNLADGTTYTGEWKNGLYHGKGRYHRKEYTYEGEWQEGEYHGQGRKTWYNAGEYNGNWEHGKRSGQGIQYFADGSVYEGGWEEDRINGWGVMTLEDGTVRKGRFKDGVLDPSSVGEAEPAREYIHPPVPPMEHPEALPKQEPRNEGVDPAWPLRNKTTAGLLAIFLGGLGIHKFYLGKVLPGVLYLLFCWTYIPALIGFIEGILYLSSTDESFQQKNKVRIH